MKPIYLAAIVFTFINSIIMNCNFVIANPPGYDKYTDQELELLPKLREIIQNEIPHGYMSENKYLIRFLRARKHNVGDAATMLRDNFRWRKELRVDNVNTHDWSKWERNYPFLYTKDKWGRPGISTGLKDFNARKLLLAGKKLEVSQYLLYGMEKSVRNIHRVSNETGREIIEGYLLFNMAGYNLRNHACLACIPGWIELAESYEKYYPQLAYKIITINAPRILQGLYQIVKPFMSEHTRNAIIIYSVDKAEWSNALLKIFDQDQLLKEFGGTAEYKIQDIRYGDS